MEILSGAGLTWLVIAGVAGCIEAMSCCLVSVWFVFGALVACVMAVAGAPAIAQMAGFILASAIGALAIRPLVMAHKKDGKSLEPTMAGETLVVTQLPVDGVRGRARDKRGMDWSFELADDVDPAARELSFGQRVHVVEQRSATLYVEPEKKA